MRVPIKELMLAGCVLSASIAHSTIQPGDTAPLFLSVSEDLRAVDMADFVDGTPLVFLYGSAT